MHRLGALVIAVWGAFAVMCFAAVPVFEIVLLETVSETSSNASIGDLNGDGHPDIVLVKGRHWQLTSKVFLGDGKGHFAPGPPLPSNATKSYSGSLADMTKSGHLDIVLSNDAPDPKLVLVNDGLGHFTVGGTYGDPNWPTRNAAVGDLNGDGLNDVIFPCRDDCQSRVFFNRNLAGEGRAWGPAKASIRAIAVADLNGDGHPDITACPEKLGCFVYFNDGKGNFSSGIQFQKPQALPYSMIAA